jgi:uncharacterized membrane protein
MYALWYAGQLVERMYGSWTTLFLYVLCGIAASAASYAFGPGGWSVGASGAIFGLFGVILVATRFHHALLDSRSRAISAQVGMLIVVNLVIGFSGVMNIDNYAHVGGLVAGLWLGLILPPAQTLAGMWQKPGGGRSAFQARSLRVLGVGALVAVVVAVVAIGTSRWQADPLYRQMYGRVPSSPELVVGAPRERLDAVRLTVE